MAGPTERRTLPAGTVLFTEGAPAEAAYLVLSGRIDLLTMRNGTRVRQGQRRSGEIVGEMALVSDRPRNATAVAGETTEILTLTPAELSRAIGGVDPTLRLWLGALFERFRATAGREAWSSGQEDGPEATPWARHVAEAADRLASEEDLRRAIDQGELELQFQPIVALASRRLAGFEALLRWPHPARGLIGPDVFIALAEQGPLINDITDLCLRLVARTFPALRDVAAREGLEQDRPLFMSVNVSGADLRRPDFAATAVSLLSAGGVDPKTIRLEVTESVLVQDLDAAARILGQCREQGMKIAIDDFGTGYSSLNYLNVLPASSLKLDKSFARSLLAEKAGRKIIEAIVQLGRALDLEVVAEGIETEEDATLLQAMGARLGQGYLFGKPVNLAQTLRLIEGWNGASLPQARRALA